MLVFRGPGGALGHNNEAKKQINNGPQKRMLTKYKMTKNDAKRATTFSPAEGADDAQ